MQLGIKIKKRNSGTELIILLLILLLPSLTFLLIILNPEAREIYPSDAPRLSLKGLHSLSLQSEENLKFVDNTTLIGGVKQYYKAWPPAYPAMLYFFKQIQISPQFVNLLIYLLSAIWFYSYLKKLNLSRLIRYLIFFSYAAGVFHYYNLATQVVSEGFFILTAQLIFTFILRYARENNHQTVVCLAILTSLSILTKYLGLLWLFPVVTCCIFFFSRNTRTGLRDLAVYGIVAILPTIPWFFWIYKTTGYLTGWDRSTARPIRHLTDFTHNAYFTLKTYYVEFFSREWASHSIVTGRYDLRIWDLFVLFLLSIIAVALSKLIYDRIRKPGIIAWEKIRDFIKDERLFFLLLTYSGFYLVIILTAWTTGNNDPIYTRFLYPSYPFLILTITKTYDLVMKKPHHQYYSILFLAFFITILTSQIYKTIVLFNRYIVI